MIAELRIRDLATIDDVTLTLGEGLNVLTDGQVTDIGNRVKAVIDDAVEFAQNAPDPAPEDAVTDLYA